MSRNAKEFMVGLLGVGGVVVLLIGLFTDAYAFMIGLVVAIGIWSVSGLLAQFWDVPKWKLRRQ